MASKNALFVLLLLVVIASLVQGSCDNNGKCWKTREAGRRRVDYHVCGNDIYKVYKHTCGFMSANYQQSRPEPYSSSDSKIIEERNAAKAFLNSRTKRSYTIVEECCSEGCVTEEVREYC